MPGEIANAHDVMVAAPENNGNNSDPTEQKVARERTVARLRLLWNCRKFLVRITGAGLLLAGAIAFLIPKRYESTTRLMPPDSQSGSSMAMLAGLANRVGGSLAAVGGDALGLKSTGVLFVGILESRTVRGDLIKRLDLRRVYGTRGWEGAQSELARNTAISEDRKSGIITIRVTDQSPQQAAAMAAEYVEELNRVVSLLSTSAAHREREFLEDRLKAVQQDLEAAEKEFSQFASKNTAIDIKEQGRAMVEAAATLQGQLIAAESELEGLKQIYTNNNVRVRSVRARIAELQHQLEKLGGKGESSSSLASAPGDSFYPSIRKLPLLGVTYADLYRRTRIQEAVFETLTQEYELAKVEEAKEIPSVKVLDPANVPERKSFPPRLLIAFLGGCVALVGGIAWSFGQAGWQNVDPQDPRKVLAREVFETARDRLALVTHNGSGLRGIQNQVLRRFHRGGTPPPAQ
jgi:uncharacterized protein involved in exopolysaccharide biosynthesis